MKYWIWLPIALVMSSFVACNNGENSSPAPSVRDTCQAGQIFASSLNLCLNRETCPEGQGRVPNENRCVAGEVIGVPPNQYTAIANYFYSGALTVGSPSQFQNMLQTMGTCDLGLQWCWPQKCPTCETWTGAVITLQTYQNKTDMASIVIIPTSVTGYQYGSPIGGSVQMSGLDSQTVVLRYTQPYRMQVVEIRFARSSLGQSQIPAEVLFQGGALGTAILFRN